MSKHKPHKEQARTIDEKTIQLFSEKRKEHKRSLFDKTRKRICKELEDAQLSKQKVQIINHINSMFDDFNSAADDRKEQLTFNIWSECYERKYKYLNQSHIEALLKYFTTLSNRFEFSSNKIKVLHAIAWLIQNWTFQTIQHFSAIKIDLVDMANTFLNLLQRSVSPELNHTLIYNLMNLSRFDEVRIQLIKAGIIHRIILCKLYQDKQADISSLFANLLLNLPKSCRIDSKSIQVLINLMSISDKKVEFDPLFQEDSLKIIGQLLSVNNQEYHGEIISKLTHVILFFFEDLKNSKNLQYCYDIFALLLKVYSTHNFNPQLSVLFSDSMIAEVWQYTQHYIKSDERDELYELFRKITRQCWKIRECICRSSMRNIKNELLGQLVDQCEEKGEDAEIESIALVLKYYEDSEILHFCHEQLINHSSNQLIVVPALKRIHQELKNKKISQAFRAKYSQIQHAVEQIWLNNEDTEIKELANLIKNIFSETNIEEQVNEKENTQSMSSALINSNNFTEISHILSKPQIPKNNYIKSHNESFMDTESEGTEGRY